MKNNAEFLSSLYEELPLPFLIADKEGNLIYGNKSLYRDFPSVKTNNSLKLIFPESIIETILSAKKIKEAYITGLNTKITVIPSGDNFCIQFLKKDDSSYNDRMMASLLLPVPHIFRTSISEMLLLVSSVYSIGERNEDDKLMELSKEMNLNCYKILRGNNLVASYCRELTPGNDEGEILDLAHLVKTVSEAARVIVNDLDVELNIDIKDDIVHVYGSEKSLTEAILALIDNAVKFSNKEPVRVTLKKAGANAVISVSDKGMGIPGDVMKDIFKPYYSFNRDSSPLSGVGLGLTLARLVALKWGGNISISSKDYEGTTAVITLPLAKTENNPEFNSKVSLTSLLRDRFSPLHVMLADNDTCPLP